MAQQRTARSARGHALAVLRVRNGLIAVALLPAAVLVVLLAGGATGHLTAGWTPLRLVLAGVALVSAVVAVTVAVTIARARPAVTPTLPVAERDAPALYALIRELAERLDVPPPGAIALTPDCDSWLEEPAPPRRGEGRPPAAPGGPPGSAPVLVSGSPFLWWMRISELRALLAPVVAGTGPSRHPDIAAARRCLRGLDAAAANAALAPARRQPRVALAGRLARLMLRFAGDHAAGMERGVAAAASARARTVDPGLRTAAQEQVGLAYAGWDRLLTRVALPAWRQGRWPARLNAGVVSSLTELASRDSLAEAYAARLTERPACDLLEEPGEADTGISLLAARLFHGPTAVGAAPDAPASGASSGAGPAGPGAVAGSPSGYLVPGAAADDRERPSGAGRSSQGAAERWPGAPLDWSAYPREVVDRLWRERAARLFTVLNEGAAPAGDASADASPASDAARGAGSQTPGGPASGPGGRGAERDARDATTGHGARAADVAPTGSLRPSAPEDGAPTLGALLRQLDGGGHDATELLAARLTARVAREEASAEPPRPAMLPGGAGGPGPLGFPLAAPLTGAETLAQHIEAAVCCAAVDATAAEPGLDWLDGPALLLEGARAPDVGEPVRALVEEADPRPLRGWLGSVGVEPDRLVRLVQGG